MTFQVGKFVREFDLFSKPFVFFVGEKKSKSTLVGGLLSLSILSVSLVYFYYLLEMYFSNKVEPKLTQSIVIENERNNIDINDNFFIMEMLISGEPLKRYEKRVGKQYLSYKIYYEKYNSDGTSDYSTLPLVECDDPQFDGFLCIPSDALKEGKNIYQEPINQISSDYAIMITPCDTEESDNCASPEEIYDVIFQSTNYFQLYTKIMQYNTNEREYKTGYKQEFFYFDSKLITYTRMSLIKATTTVTEGIIIQKSETKDTIYDYKRIDTYFTNDDTVYNRMGIYGYAYIVFEINQVHNYVFVQHAMITEVLAQFMSIFNSMLTIGIIARMLAESHIVEDVNNILLKEYYKQTALKLVKRQEGKQILVRIKNDLKKKKNSDSSKNIAAKLDEFNQKIKQKQIIELQNTICETDFSEKQKEFFELGFWEKFKLSIFSLFGKHSAMKFKSQKNPDSIIYRNLIQQSMKRINIFEVYKDLIKLKMAIKLVLTKDQYAAIHFCGSDIHYQQPLSSEINPNQSVDNNKQNQKQEVAIPIPPELPQKQLDPTIRQSINGSPNQTFQENFQINSQVFINGNNNECQQINPNKIIQQTKFNSQEISQPQQPQDVKTIKQLNQLSPNYKFSDDKKQFKQSSYQNPVNNKNEINNSKKQQIESRDKIQSLHVKGDENTVTTSQQSSEDLSDNQSISEDQPEIQQVQGQSNNNILSNFKSNTLRHLQEMDKIEEDILQREKFLQEFLDKMNKSENFNNNEISHIDKQIYSSLIFNDQPNLIIDLIDHGNNDNQEQPMRDKVFSIDQQIGSIQQNQNQRQKSNSIFKQQKNTKQF